MWQEYLNLPHPIHLQDSSCQVSQFHDDIKQGTTSSIGQLNLSKSCLSIVHNFQNNQSMVSSQ